MSNSGATRAKKMITSKMIAAADMAPMSVASEEAVEAASSLMRVTPALWMRASESAARTACRAVSNALVTGMSSTAPIDSLLRMLSAQ